MGLFSNLFQVFTQPIVNVLNTTSSVVSTVLQVTDNVTDAASDIAVDLTAGIPVVGKITQTLADEFDFQEDLATDLFDDYQVTVASLTELVQFLGIDVLDPTIDEVGAILEQGGIYIDDTYLTGTLNAIVQSLDSLGTA